MVNNRILYLFIFFLTTGVTVNISAHIGINNPQGGENFQAGNVVPIQWYILINHGSCNYDLLFSSDGGVTWDSIANNLPQTQLTFDWTLPNVQTNLGQIKVVQDNDVGTDYDAASGNFTTNYTTGIDEKVVKINAFKLYNAYPNPFNPSTKINYSVPMRSIVSLKIFDLLGNQVSELVNREIEPGTYDINFNAINLPSGVYFYRLRAGSFVETKKMILLK